MSEELNCFEVLTVVTALCRHTFASTDKYQFHIAVLSLAGVQLKTALYLQNFSTENGNKGSTATVASYQMVGLKCFEYSKKEI